MPAVQIIVVKGGVVIGTHLPSEPLTSWVPIYESDNTINYFESDTLVSLNDIVSDTAIEVGVFEGGMVVQTEVSVDSLVTLTEVPDPRIDMTTSQAKAAAISNVTLYHKYKILKQYPTQMQLDINALATDPLTGSAYSAQNKTDMQTYINTQNAAIRTKSTAINGLADTAAVIAYADYYA